MIMASTRNSSGSSTKDFNLFEDLTPVRRYKLILQTFIKRRGSGTSQAIADGLGVTRGYVSQITSPAYDLPIPGPQVSKITVLAGLSSAEERLFLSAYLEAHPDRAVDVVQAFEMEKEQILALAVPRLSNELAQSRMENLIRRISQDVIAALSEVDQNGGTGKAKKVRNGQ